MPDSTSILRTLAQRGLIREPYEVRRLGGGNADRHPDRARTHLLVAPAAEPPLKLTIGRGLAAARERARGFAQALPALAPQERFFVQVEGLDAWAVDAVVATPVDEFDRDAAGVVQALVALDEVNARLAATRAPSDARASEREWEQFAGAVRPLSCWSAPERAFLDTALFPWLHEGVAQDTWATRWTNGDFTSGNVGVDLAGRPVVFDGEFAARTHFTGEDAVRFRRISPLCHRHPALLEHWWPHDEPAWEAFFQLRQLVLEFQENSDAYLARVVPERKAAIRAFAESSSCVFPAPWPAPAAPEPRVQGEPVQLFWRDERGAFSEACSMRTAIRAGIRQFVAFRLPGRHAQWRFDPAGSPREVRIHALEAVLGPRPTRGTTVPFRVEGARSRRTDGCTVLEPLGPDPQLHFALPDGAIGVVIELECP